MRTIWMALLVLCGILWTGSEAEARSRTEQVQARPAATQTERAAATRREAGATRAPTRPAAARGTAPRREAAEHGARSRQVAGRSGTTRQELARSGRSRQAAARSRTARGAAGRPGRTRHSAATCQGRDCGSIPHPVAWQAGLAPATNMQAAACPAGTMATLARGHTNIVRCLPL